MASTTFAYGFAVIGFTAGILGLLLLAHKDYDEQYEKHYRTVSRTNLRRQEQAIGHWTEWTSQPCAFSGSGCIVIVIAKCNTSSAVPDCPGLGFYRANCTAENCPAIWTEWATGKDNNDVCIHTRERNCTDIPSAPNCNSLDTETVFCNTSQWSMWSNWTCHLDQYNQCIQYRSRECYLGLDHKQCQGERSQLINCTMDHCKNYLQPVWSEWTDPICFNDSSGCFIVRNRSCSAGIERHCNGRAIDIKVCGENDCKATWLAWSQWVCAWSDNEYKSHRTRNCSTGKAYDCKGVPYETLSCGKVECPECQIQTTPQPVHGSWLEWSHWQCLDDTTVINARRVRNCSTGANKDCDGRHYFLGICSDKECPECYKVITTSLSTESINFTTTPTQSTTTTTVELCEDAYGFQCTQPDIQDVVCKDKTIAEQYCRKTCRHCEPAWSSWECTVKLDLIFKKRHRNCNTAGCEGNELIYCNQSTCPECFNVTASPSISRIPSTIVTVLPTVSTVHQGTTDSVVDTCRDESGDECKKANFQSIVCNDTYLARRHCRKTCKLCVPQDQCSDRSGCDGELQSIACNSPTTSILCPVACGLCTPFKCKDVPHCNEELGSLICDDPETKALCPVRCGLCLENRTTDTTKPPVVTDIPDSGKPSSIQTTVSPKPTNGPVGTPAPVNPTFAITAAPIRQNTTTTTNRQKSTRKDTDITTVVTTMGPKTTTSSAFTVVTNGLDKTSTTGAEGTDLPNMQDTSTSTLFTPAKSNATTTMIKQVTSTIVTTTNTAFITDKLDGQSKPTTSTTDALGNSLMTSAKTSSVAGVQTSKTDTTTPTESASPDLPSTPTAVGSTSTQKQNTDTISTGINMTSETKTTKNASVVKTNAPTTVEKTTGAPTTESIITTQTTSTRPNLQTTHFVTTLQKSTRQPTTNTQTTIMKTTKPRTTSIPTTVLKTTHLSTMNTQTTALKTTHLPTTPLLTTIPPTTPRPTTFPPTIAALTTRAGGGGHTISPDPTQCAVCVGPPELCDQLYEIKTCAPPNNYCINHVKNYEDGSRDVVRTCGNHRTCYREWFQGSSDNDKCQNFEEDNVITLSFECTYCCIKNECNIKLYPDIDTLYKDV